MFEGTSLGRTLADVVGGAIAAAVLVIVVMIWRSGPSYEDASQPGRLGAAGAPTTSREDLARAIERMEARLAADASDRGAAILLADALMRQARVTGQAALTHRAVPHLERLLRAVPSDYEARRMLATVYASEHRFRDAIREGDRARVERPDDPWNYGIIGDSHLELGEYEEAFAAFQHMLDLKPSAAAYSRVSYAFELQGRLGDAIDSMRLAVDATNPRDPESIAWFRAHLAELYIQVGRVPEARLEYAWAERAFQRHPFVRAGVARLKEFEGDDTGALAMYREAFDEIGTPELAVAIGELYERGGRRDEAERMYAAAEARWRSGGAAEQDHLARFLADHDRHVDEAVRLAEDSASTTRDIAAHDALAWAYFKAGRLAEAHAAVQRALRTGTRSVAILYHAAIIHAARGDREGARRLLSRVPSNTCGTLRISSAVEALRARLDTSRVVALRQADSLQVP